MSANLISVAQGADAAKFEEKVQQQLEQHQQQQHHHHHDDATDVEEDGKWSTFRANVTADFIGCCGGWNLGIAAPAAEDVVDFIVTRLKSDERPSRDQLVNLLVNLLHMVDQKTQVRTFVVKVFKRMKELKGTRYVSAVGEEEGTVSDIASVDCAACQNKRLLNCDLSKRSVSAFGKECDIDAANGVMGPCENCRFYGGENCECRRSNISTAEALRRQFDNNKRQHGSQTLLPPALGKPSKMANVDPRWTGQPRPLPPRLPDSVQNNPLNSLPTAYARSPRRSVKPRPGPVSEPQTSRTPITVNPAPFILMPGLEYEYTYGGGYKLRNNSSVPINISDQKRVLEDGHGLSAPPPPPPRPHKAPQLNRFGGGTDTNDEPLFAAQPSSGPIMHSTPNSTPSAHSNHKRARSGDVDDVPRTTDCTGVVIKIEEHENM